MKNTILSSLNHCHNEIQNEINGSYSLENPKEILTFLLQQALQEKQWNTALKTQEMLLKLDNNQSKKILPFKKIQHAEFILEELEKLLDS